MTPEDLDKIAKIIKEEGDWGSNTPLFLRAQALLETPNRIGAAFIWGSMEDLITSHGFNWDWKWFDQYGDGRATKGAGYVTEVLKRLAKKPHFNLGDYL